MSISIELAPELSEMYPELGIDHVDVEVDEYDPRTGIKLDKKGVSQRAKLVCKITGKGCGEDDVLKQEYQSDMQSSSRVVIKRVNTALKGSCYICPVYEKCNNGKN